MRRSLRVVAVSIVVATGVAAPAEAAVGAPFKVSPAGVHANFPDVAVDTQGDATFVWLQFDGPKPVVYTRNRSANGMLTTPQRLSAPGESASEPQVAVDKNGDAVFAWLRSDGTNIRVQARARSTGGVLSAVKSLSPAGEDASGPRLGVDTTGDAVFTWIRSDGTNTRVQTRARSAAGALSSVKTVSAPGGDADKARIAVDGSGDAVLAWYRFEGSIRRIQAAVRSSIGTLSAVENLSVGGQNADDPDVAVTAGGDAVFSWLRFDGQKQRIQTRARSAAGQLTGVQNLSVAGLDAFHGRVGLDADGGAVFSWVLLTPRGDRMQTRERSASGALTEVQSVSPADAFALEPSLAVDEKGRSVFSWRRRIGSADRIEARARSAGGALSGTQTISGSGAFSSQIAPAGDLGAVFTWQRGDATHQRAEAAVGRPS